MPLVLCPRFENGFSTREFRNAHCKRHERPFKCEYEECDYSAIGFSTKADSVTDEPIFPTINRCPVEKALKDAIDNDDAIAVRALATEISDLQEIETGFLMHAIESGSRKSSLILMEILGDTREMNHQDVSGSTALHNLAKIGDVELLEAMLETCVNVNAMNQKNETALHVAILYQDNISIVRLLMRHVKFDFAKHNHAILHFVVSVGNDQALRMLLEASKDTLSDGEGIVEALTTTISSGRRDLTGTLLVWGRVLRIESKYPAPYDGWVFGEVDDMLPVFMGEISFEQAIADKFIRDAFAIGDPNQIKQLLLHIRSSNGIDLISAEHGTLLATAASRGYINIVEVLLSSGASVDLPTLSGNTALIAAAANGHKEVVTSLLAAGAKVDKTNGVGLTALAAAKENGHHETAEFLRERGASLIFGSGSWL
jgi:ankyrin repeat protein